MGYRYLGTGPNMSRAVGNGKVPISRTIDQLEVISGLRGVVAAAAAGGALLPDGGGMTNCVFIHFKQLLLFCKVDLNFI